MLSLSEKKAFQNLRFFKEHDEGMIVSGRKKPKEINTIISNLHTAEFRTVKKLPTNKQKRKMGQGEFMVVSRHNLYYEEYSYKENTVERTECGSGVQAIVALPEVCYPCYNNIFYPLHYKGRAKRIEGTNKYIIDEEEYAMCSNFSVGKLSNVNQQNEE